MPSIDDDDTIPTTKPKTQLITTDEFEEIIRLQKVFLNACIQDNWQFYQDSLSQLAPLDAKIVEQHRVNIINTAEKKIERIRQVSGFRFGAVRYREVYFQSLFFPLLPILYQNFKGRFTHQDIKNWFTDTSITNFFIENYPSVFPCLNKIQIHFSTYRKELFKQGLAQKLGYNEVDSVGNQKPKIYVSLIKELMNELDSNSAEKAQKIKEVLELDRQNKNQTEISQLVGISQGNVSKILSKHKF